MSSIRLVPRADDAGLNKTSNRAIRASITDGIVRNVSLMATAPAIDDAAETLLPLASGIDFGLHVTLTSEWDPVRWGPITPEAETGGLVRRDKTFHLKVSEINTEELTPDLVVAEVRAQLDRLVSLGFKPAYLDEHMDVGSIPMIASALEELAAKEGLVVHRSLAESGRLSPLPGWQGPAEHPGTELADHLSGVPAGTYVLVGHPGTKDDEMQMLKIPGGKTGEVALRRNRERRMFMDIEIVDYCENVGIELLRYSDV